MPEKDSEIGALWARVSKRGARFLSGKIAGVDVVLFENDKKGNEKAPDWRVFKSEPRQQGPTTQRASKYEQEPPF